MIFFGWLDVYRLVPTSTLKVGKTIRSMTTTTTTNSQRFSMNKFGVSRPPNFKIHRPLICRLPRIGATDNLPPWASCAVRSKSVNVLNVLLCASNVLYCVRVHIRVRLFGVTHQIAVKRTARLKTIWQNLGTCPSGIAFFSFLLARGVAARSGRESKRQSGDNVSVKMSKFLSG